MTNEKANLPEREKRKNDGKEVVAQETRFNWSTIREFTNEVKAEFGKIAWPNKKHTARSAMLVVLLISIMSLYLGSVDLLIGKLISYILK
ncbi:MAG: preprotein translocase subunit SecE [Desulfobulbaceae bacterium]|nr:preprotein translocase subunit SecE [Desulfobulbaceae bacterium]